MLLYLAAVLLLTYLSLLYVRLRANVRALRARSEFEHLIAGISGRLIDTPAGRTAHALRQALEQLGRHVGVDRAYVVLHGAEPAAPATSYTWSRDGIDASDGWPEAALTFSRECPLHRGREPSWHSKDYERYCCIDVPSVTNLPRGEVKARLAACGIRAWLCVPLWHAGTNVGLLGFDAVVDEKRWTDDDIALLRTIGEILVNALFRERGERERQRLESRLRQAERLESLGTLAGGIAHDFNNILGAILGYAEILLSRLRRDSREWQNAQEVKKAGERARTSSTGSWPSAAGPTSDIIRCTCALCSRRPRLCCVRPCRRRSTFACVFRMMTPQMVTPQMVTPACWASRGGCSRWS